MKETFAALLAKADVRMPHLTAAMADLLARRLAGGDASAKPTAADTETVNRMLMRIFSVDDVIYKKVRSCTATHALRTQLLALVRLRLHFSRACACAPCRCTALGDARP